MTFQITFLGVGSGMTPELGNTNVLVEGSDPHEVLLLDCGYTAPGKLNQIGRMHAVEHIVISHVHADHAAGLEGVGVLHRYGLGHRPHLYIPDAIFDELWGGMLRGGMERSQDLNGDPTFLTLDDYFVVHRLPDDALVVELPGLPTIRLTPTLHVQGKPCYSLFLGDDVYFSCDTQLLPPREGPTGKPLAAIFQDCQLAGSKNVHTTLEELAAEMPPEQKQITRLMHYGRGHEAIDAVALGFMGFVQPLLPYALGA